MTPQKFQAMLGYALAAFAATLVLVNSAQAASKYQVLHRFADKPAAQPWAGLVADSAGNLYGTTRISSPDSCGTPGCGVVFKLTRGSGGTWSYSVIYRFHGSDGAQPEAGLIFDSAGNLYGTTNIGGASNCGAGCGTVFELTPGANGEWTEKVLYNFTGYPDLANPEATLTFDASGNLYGTAAFGGNGGGVFQLRPSSNGWQETVIYGFTGGNDGGQPMANLTWDSAGNLYSTANIGGRYQQGVVFELTPSSGGTWTETVLHNFTGGADGGRPIGGVSFDNTGNLYGTTVRGGHLLKCANGGCGTVFKLTSSMGWQESTVLAFNLADGALPLYGLISDPAGNFYGTATSGGKYGNGVVFKLSPSGSGWTETLLHSFTDQGGNTLGGLVLDQQGILYGTTLSGSLYGLVYSLAP